MLLHILVSAGVLLVVICLFALAGKTYRGAWLWSVQVDTHRKEAIRSADSDLAQLRDSSHLGLLCEAVFFRLQWLSVATWVFGTRAASQNVAAIKAEEPKRGVFVEYVMLGWVLLCATTYYWAYGTRSPFAKDLLCALAILRVVDILQANVNAHLFDVLRVRESGKDGVRSLQRSLLLAAVNYMELIGWFGVIYGTFSLATRSDDFSGFSDYLYFSAITQLTVGYGESHPVCAGKLLAPAQAMLGTLLLVLGVARLVAAIPASAGSRRGPGGQSP